MIDRIALLIGLIAACALLFLIGSNSDNLMQMPRNHNNLNTKIDRGIESHRRVSPVCAFKHSRGLGLSGSRINRIILVHMRKAGGTLLYYYLKKVARKYNISFEAIEGKRPPSPEKLDNTTLLITHIREPISRVLSDYKYEVRWSCKDLTKPSEEFIPNLNNTRISLDTFVQTPNMPVNINSPQSKLWECSHNCYAKWSTGLCWIEGNYNDSTFCWSLTDTRDSFLSIARRTLYAYNLIIVMEWLKNPDYLHSIEAIFGESGLDKKKIMWCGPNAAAANEKYPLEYSDETLRSISLYNQLDTMLYKELTHCDSLSFPNQSIFSY
jgi:hypothetical protein